MTNREQKVKELMEGFQSLKQHEPFHSMGSGALPRITPAQWRILILIEGQGQSTVKGLASMLSITSSAATQLIDGLVESGYVLRETSKEDRRVVSLTLSKKTKAQVEKMKKHVLHKFLDFFEVLNDREFNQYLLLTQKIVERFSKHTTI